MKENKPLKIPYYYQNKITIVSFVLVIMMLYVHGIYNESELFRMSYIVKSIISRLSYRVINPTYFSISGFLFFYGINAMADCFPKMKKRIHTVLIPFILWNLIVVLENLIFYQIPFSSEFFNFNLLDKYNDISAVIYNLLICPAGFHLWFLRDLILIIAITPLLYGIKMVTPLGVLSPVLCICTCFFPQIGLLKSIFWFVFGSEYFVHIGKCKSIVIPILFICLCITELLFPHEYWKHFTSPIILLGILSIWNLFDRLAKENFSLKQHRLLSLSCQFTFFIYLYHEPFINVIRKLLAFILGRNSFAFASSYLTSPWFVIVIGILVGYAFKKSSPKIYSILTGGR